MFIMLELQCFVASHGSRDDGKYQEDYGLSMYLEHCLPCSDGDMQHEEPPSSFPDVIISSCVDSRKTMVCPVYFPSCNLHTDILQCTTITARMAPSALPFRKKSEY